MTRGEEEDEEEVIRECLKENVRKEQSPVN